MKINFDKITTARATKILRLASMCAIAALALMVWSLFDPTPAPVLIALSVGQVIGTISFIAYLAIVYWDIRRRPAPPDSQALRD